MDNYLALAAEGNRENRRRRGDEYGYLVSANASEKLTVERADGSNSYDFLAPAALHLSNQRRFPFWTRGILPVSSALWRVLLYDTIQVLTDLSRGIQSRGMGIGGDRHNNNGSIDPCPPYPYPPSQDPIAPTEGIFFQQCLSEQKLCPGLGINP